MSAMQAGTQMVKLRGSSKGLVRFYFLDEHRSCIRWRPSRKNEKAKSEWGSLGEGPGPQTSTRGAGTSPRAATGQRVSCQTLRPASLQVAPGVPHGRSRPWGFCGNLWVQGGVGAGPHALQGPDSTTAWQSPLGLSGD